jgi:hypothetical protein
MKSKAIFLLGLILSSSTSWAVSESTVFTPDVSKIAKVRIPLTLISYENVVVQDAKTNKNVKAKPLAPRKFALRTTVDRVNHFYLADWHVEVLPVEWESATKNFKAKVKFYKRFGDGSEIEEYAGSLDLESRLEGEGLTYFFAKPQHHILRDKTKARIAEVHFGFRSADDRQKFVALYKP